MCLQHKWQPGILGRAAVCTTVAKFDAIFLDFQRTRQILQCFVKFSPIFRHQIFSEFLINFSHFDRSYSKDFYILEKFSCEKNWTCLFFSTVTSLPFLFKSFLARSTSIMCSLFSFVSFSNFSVSFLSMFNDFCEFLNFLLDCH